MDDIFPGECLVYSLGLGGDTTFDQKMNKLGCVVHGYESRDFNYSLKEKGIFLHSGTEIVPENPENKSRKSTLEEELAINGHNGSVITYLKVILLY